MRGLLESPGFRESSVSCHLKQIITYFIYNVIVEHVVGHPTATRVALSTPGFSDRNFERGKCYRLIGPTKSVRYNYSRSPGTEMSFHCFLCSDEKEKERVSSSKHFAAGCAFICYFVTGESLLD